MSTIAVAPVEAVEPAAASYRAAVVHEFGTPADRRGRARGRPRRGQIRVKVEASGLCHTDIHAAHGDWPVKP